MANWFRRPGGAVVIQFSGLDKRKRTLSLGEASDGTADRAFRVVKALVDAARYSQPTPPDVAAWLGALPDETYARFVAAGLVNAREKRDAAPVTFAETARKYHARRTDIKPASRLVLEQAVRNIREFFGDKPLTDVTEADADDFARWMATEARVRGKSGRLAKGLAPATLGKRLSWTATLCRDAVKRKLIPSNPFDDVKKPSGVNSDRKVYVPVETIQQLIDAEPDPEWRALLALSRFLGVRVPSEPFSMFGRIFTGRNCGFGFPPPRRNVTGNRIGWHRFFRKSSLTSKPCTRRPPREASTFSPDCGSGIPTRRRRKAFGRR